MVKEEWDFEESRKPDFKNDKLVELIKPFYNAVSKEKLLFLHHGSYNVYAVDEYIFRIPDKTLYNQKGYKLIVEEQKKLNFFRKHLQISIPQPVFISGNPDKPLVGYKKIKGVALGKVWNELHENKKLRIAESIGSFLTKLHSTELLKKYIEEFKIEKMPRECIKTNFESIFETTQKKIYPLLSPELQAFVNEIFTKFLDDFKYYNFIPCMTHQDFDTSNILVDPETGRITGIIDFEDTGLGDPAYDLIFIDQGKSFFETILKNYQNDTDEYLYQRILFYYKRTGIPYLLYGIENNLADMIQYGKYILKKRQQTNFKNN